LARARANGRIGGGRFKLTPKQQQQAIVWIRSGEKTQSEVAEFFSLDRSTVSRMMSDVRAKEQKKAGLL
jgi:DNA invertase Pin-like site-specific DNA recombinase